MKTDQEASVAGSAQGRRRPGRPPVYEVEAVRSALRGCVARGVRTLTIAELIRMIVAETRCSKRTGYRLLRRASQAGLVRLPGF